MGRLRSNQGNGVPVSQLAKFARFARGDIRSKSDVIPNARASLFLQEVSLSIEQRAGNSLPSLSSGMSAQRSSIIADTQTKRRRTFLRSGHAAQAFPILSPGAPISSLSRNIHNSTAYYGRDSVYEENWEKDCSIHVRDGRTGFSYYEGQRAMTANCLHQRQTRLRSLFSVCLQSG